MEDGRLIDAPGRYPTRSQGIANVLVVKDDPHYGGFAARGRTEVDDVRRAWKLDGYHGAPEYDIIGPRIPDQYQPPAYIDIMPTKTSSAARIKRLKAAVAPEGMVAATLQNYTDEPHKPDECWQYAFCCWEAAHPECLIWQVFGWGATVAAARTAALKIAEKLVRD
jgi:hypothetical protein